MKHRLRTQAKWTWGNRHRTQSLTFLSLSILYSLKFLWFFSQNILKAGMRCFKIGLLLSHDHRKPSCWWADSIYFLRGASESGRKVNESWNPVWKHICMQCAWVENLKLWPMRPLMERETVFTSKAKYSEIVMQLLPPEIILRDLDTKITTIV